MTKRFTPAELTRAVDQLLAEGLPQAGGIRCCSYYRVPDDHDGEPDKLLAVLLTETGDVFIQTHNPDGSPLRFRTKNGGGASPRVQRALVILARAIQLENETNPQS